MSYFSNLFLVMAFTLIGQTLNAAEGSVHRKRKKNYICTYENCPYKTDRKSRIENHILRRHINKEIKGKNCNKKANNATQLNIHINGISKPYTPARRKSPGIIKFKYQNLTSSKHHQTRSEETILLRIIEDPSYSEISVQELRDNKIIIESMLHDESLSQEWRNFSDFQWEPFPDFLNTQNLDPYFPDFVSIFFPDTPNDIMEFGPDE